MMKTPFPHSKNGKKAIKQAKKVEKNGLKKPIRKIDKNRVYAWVLLVLMVFWTFASVLSIMNAFGKDTKTISASAEEAAVNVDYNGMTIDPFQYPTANLLNWPYNTVNKNVDGVDVSTTEKGTFLLTGTCEKTKFASYVINTKNTYFIVGATYTMSVSTLSGSANLPQSVRFALACKFLDGSTKVLANVFLGQNSTFVVPDGALFFYIEFGFGWYEQVLTFDGLELGLMYNQGATAYPYQPPYQLVYANGFNNGADSSYNSGYDKGLQDGAAIAQRGIFNGLYADCNVFYYDENNNYTNKRFVVNPTFSTNTAYFSNIVSVIEHQDADIYWDKIEQIDIIFRYKSGTFPLVKDFNLYMFGEYGVFGPDDYNMNFTLTTSSGDLTCKFVDPEEYVSQGTRIMRFNENQTIIENAQVYSIGTFTLYRGQTGKFTLQSYNESGFGAGYDAGYSAGENDFKNGQGYKDALNAAQNKGFEQGKVIGYDQGVQSANDYSFFSLLSAVVDAPLAMFRDMFNFEILGVNLSSFALGLLTLAMVLGVVKLIL